MPHKPEAVTLTVHRVSEPDVNDPEQLARSRTVAGRLKMLLVLLVCAAPVLASYFTYFVLRPEGRTNYGTLIQPTRALPEGALHALNGAAVAPDALHGQWLLLAVGASSCEAACGRRLFMQRQLREMMGKERDRVDKVWLVSDEAPIPAQLLQAMAATPAVTVLRADAAALARWLPPAPKGSAADAHLYVVDPMGELMMRFPPEPEPGRVKRDLERLLRASAFWDRSGR
jgi:hypothetical protein